MVWSHGHRKIRYCVCRVTADTTNMKRYRMDFDSEHTLHSCTMARGDKALFKYYPTPSSSFSLDLLLHFVMFI